MIIKLNKHYIFYALCHPQSIHFTLGKNNKECIVFILTIKKQ
jgi:hypothetical protein